MKKRIISLLLMIVMIVSIVPFGTISASAVSGSEIVAYARQFIGKSYVWGTAGPNTFDCSGLVKFVFANFGISLPHSTGMLWENPSAYGTVVGTGRTNNAVAGDLILWSGHVAIYTENGHCVEALNRKYGVTEAVSVNSHTNGMNYKVLRVRGVSYGGNSTPTPPKPAAPSKPSLGSISASNIAKGRTVTFTWNATDRATGYKVAIRGAETKDIDVGNATSYSYVLSKSGTYSFYAMAYNSTGNSGWTSDCRSCNSHDPVTVKFVDWNGSVLKTQTVDYGLSATAPSIPSRKGYDFQGWNGLYTGVTKDSVVKALYKIKTYTVNFLDKSGKILKSEKVNYGSNATPPTDTNAPTGYEFHGWSSEAYKNVYTEASNRIINISAIYEWANDDLPIICNITSAYRQNDGYYVNFDLTNYDKQLTRGRAIVSLKTAEGKLVDSAESTAFSIPIDSTKRDIEVYLPCDSAATKVEVIVVNSYSSGVPISEKKTATVDKALSISEWSNIKPIADEKDIDTRIVYSFRNKIKTTGNTNKLQGYEWDGTYSSYIGGWSAWQDSYIGRVSFTVGNSYSREVKTQSVGVYSDVWYPCYYHFYKAGNGNHIYCPRNHGGAWHSINVLDSEMEWWGSSSCSSSFGKYRGPACGTCGQSQYWFRSINQDVDGITKPVLSGTKTQYQYRDTTYKYNFYKWSDWSEWSTESIKKIDGEREVKTETQYRNLNTSAIIENNSGKERTISGKLGTDYAGKQITLYVYGWVGASDFTNQYIGQSVVGEDGSYSFTFKLLNEPTIETGDYTVSIGIEGTTDTIEIGKIEAPVPTYSVKFYNWDGTILSEQTVSEGKTATLPENPVREGYDFIGWDNSIANIKEDVELNPIFEKKQFTVTFIDWKNKAFVQQKFGYGDVLTPPDHSSVEGYNFDGWDKIIDGTFVVTEDMVVTAEYSKKSYSVKFFGFDGNVIDSQTVKFGEDAVAPDNAGTADDGRIFAGWQDNGYTDVNGDAYVYPVYYYETTAQMPTVTYEKDGEQVECPNGEYNAPITITLSTNDENDVIYYSINGSDHNEEIEYTGPITIDKTCSITYYATGFGKNDSEPNTNYYCINTGDKMSDWMTIDELPEAVRNAIGQEDSDYKIEKEVGYRFKDLTETSDVATAKNLADNGWTLISTTYTDYSDWQNEKIDVDSSKLGFEVDTNNGATDGQEFRYLYSHYKYVDANGETQYSQNIVDGFDCEYEEIYLDEKINIDPETYSYIYDGQSWYSRRKVMTEYRSRYQVSSYYKWTGWGITPPISSDTREVETTDVYRYSTSNYHIVTVYTMDYYPEIMFVRDGETVDVTKISDLYGYNYKGLYKDEDYKTAFNAKTDIRESMKLYAKYTPKTYTVTFQMPNGVIVDEQEVEYMGSAVDPGSDDLEGYVFGGWDKDFSCITEDTVVTGKYYKESEYPRIALNRSSVVLYTGTYFDLIATITPSDLVGKEIEWSSSDSSVATVDEYGKVTALKAGQTVIMAKVVENKETASCTITVQSDLASKLMLKEDSKLNRDDIGYIRRVALQTPVSNVKNEFINENIKFINIGKDGNEVVLSDTDLIGTGTIVRLMDGSAISDEAKFVITGDVDGDGKCTLKDSTHIMQYLLETEEFAPYQIGASDVNGDGFVNNKDAALIARFIAKLDVING